MFHGSLIYFAPLNLPIFYSLLKTKSQSTSNASTRIRLLLRISSNPATSERPQTKVFDARCVFNVILDRVVRESLARRWTHKELNDIVIVDCDVTNPVHVVVCVVGERETALM